ncbi:hypothetical protein [Myxococcus sp. Y35]|uniref:hypothetical protein n=1 Tax=Pseudomyxococcus flavus TaxID=3115648 RepID=UPI003CED884E
MTLKQLKHFRQLSHVTWEALIGDAEVHCVDYTIPGHQRADIGVSVISRKDHAVPGPAVYFMHGGGEIGAGGWGREAGEGS